MDWLSLAVPPLIVALSLLTSVHLLLHKEEPRAAVGWMGLIWLVPLLGTLLYLVLGINRIQRKAVGLRSDQATWEATRARELEHARTRTTPVDPDLSGFEPLVALGDGLRDQPLLSGNDVVLLDSGDAAYPAMLEAIEGATQSIALLTYIFDNDQVGQRFVEALGAATRRGVEVRVLVDAFGARYSRPTIMWVLRRAGVPCACFLPARMWSVAYLNLRNHRKVCVVDGHTAFTGGMNIRGAHVLAEAPPNIATRDLHVCARGPIVAQLQGAFAQDWAFATGETLSGDAWYPTLSDAGDAHARVIQDGPDDHLDAARLTFLGALSVAQRSVRVVTPYFLPDEALTTGLITAALRGVEVDVVLPQHSNLPYVDWATAAELAGLVERGVRVWHAPPPFDHSKLMVVDRRWIAIGSANWDPRSLRLNFELLMEVFDHPVAEAAEAVVASRLEGAIRVTTASLVDRPLWVRLRDHVARLFKPYL